MWYIIIFIFSTFFLLYLLRLKSKPVRKVKLITVAPLGYKLFYTDETPKKRKKKVIYKKILYSKKYNIQGKPDFIYKKGNKCFVVELKSGKIKNNDMPYFGDLMQLVSYFLIVEDVYGYKVKKGKLIYSDCAFVVKNTKSLRRQVLEIIDSMRNMLKTGYGYANPSFIHCRYCMCRQTVCTHYKTKN